jgi:hypothetical protein
MDKISKTGMNQLETFPRMKYVIISFVEGVGVGVRVWVWV